MNDVFRSSHRGWNHLPLVLAMGLGNLPAVRVQTGKTVQLYSRTVKNPDLDPYPSTGRLCRVWLDLSVPISGSMFWIFLFIGAFRYPTVNRKILTFAHRCSFQMNRLPL